MMPVRLTGRGRGAGAGGLVLVIAGTWLELAALLAAGLFALALTAASLGTALLLRRGASVARADSSAAASVGDDVTTTAAVRVPGAAPAAVVSGLVPPWGSSTDQQPVVLLPPWRGERCAARTFTCQRRGRYPWPSVAMQVPEPLGMSYAVVRSEETSTFLVYPRVLPAAGAALEPAGASPGTPTAGRHLRRSAAAGSASDPIPRAYLPGDELRRMHWPATARAGEPMVRTDDHEPVHRTVVALDCSASAYRTDAGFERAVAASASLAVALLNAGQSVSLQTRAAGLLTTVRWLEGRQGVAAALAALAEVALGTAGASVGAAADATARWVVTGAHYQPGTRRSSEPTVVLSTETIHNQEPPADEPSPAVWDGTSSLTAALRRATAVAGRPA